MPPLDPSVIADLSATATPPFGLYLAGPDEPLADHARELEVAVFSETFGNTREMLVEEYGPYDDVSSFIVVLDHHRARAAGMIRLILDGHGSLKSMTDIEREPWNHQLATALAEAGIEHLDPSEALDVTTLAVDPDYRGGASNSLVSLALYQGLVHGAVVGRFQWLVTVLDVVVLDLIQSTCSAPFHFYPGVEPMRYLDSPASVPVWCEMADYESRMRARDPGMAETLFDGAGLEAAVSPPDYVRGMEIARSLTSAEVLDLREGRGADATAPQARHQLGSF